MASFSPKVFLPVLTAQCSPLTAPPAAFFSTTSFPCLPSLADGWALTIQLFHRQIHCSGTWLHSQHLVDARSVHCACTYTPHRSSRAKNMFVIWESGLQAHIARACKLYMHGAPGGDSKKELQYCMETMLTIYPQVVVASPSMYWKKSANFRAGHLWLGWNMFGQMFFVHVLITAGSP